MDIVNFENRDYEYCSHFCGAWLRKEGTAWPKKKTNYNSYAWQMCR